MDISATTIDHREQRFPTTGDWLFHPRWMRQDGEDTEMLDVRVSDLGDWRYEAMVGVHEIIEALLCKHAGIAEKDVAKFDIAYEGLRDAIHGNHTDHDKMTLMGNFSEDLEEFGCSCAPTEESEPGDDFHAPYYKQHQLATSVERMLGAEMDVDWNAYEKANLDLYENAKTE